MLMIEDMKMTMDIIKDGFKTVIGNKPFTLRNRMFLQKHLKRRLKGTDVKDVKITSDTITLDICVHPELSVKEITITIDSLA